MGSLVKSSADIAADVVETYAYAPAQPRDEHDTLLTPAEVAAIFRVDPKTVTRWAAAGKLVGIKTLGGHRRFWKSHIEAVLAGEQ